MRTLSIAIIILALAATIHPTHAGNDEDDCSCSQPASEREQARRGLREDMRYLQDNRPADVYGDERNGDIRKRKLLRRQRMNPLP